MPDNFYGRLQGRVDKLIRKFGEMQTIVQEKQGAYDPSTGQSAVVTTNFPVPMVTFPYDERFINGTTIKATDLWGYFSAVGLPGVPQTGDKLLHSDGSTYTFVNVKPLNPGGVVLEYECHLTKG